MQGEGFKGAIQELAMSRLAELEEKRNALAADLQEVNQEISLVRAVLKPLAPPSDAPKRRAARERKPDKDWTPAPDIREAFIEWITDLDEEITVRKIKERFPSMSNWIAQQLPVWGRDSGLLRLSGQQGNAKIYRSLLMSGKEG